MNSKGNLINPGDILQDRYHILSQIDSGVFSNTYLAEDVELTNKLYLIERFAPQLTEDITVENARKFLEKEVGFFFNLQHSQIPKYRELLCYQKRGKQYLFLVHDYVKGNTYEQLLNHRLEENKKFQEVEIEVLLKNILPILDYCHSKGVIHCNISPDNIILREADQLPILVNFGYIKKAEKQISSRFNNKLAVNTTLPFVGTALEIADFAPREQVDQDIVFAHSDLYALAATAVVLLTGKGPEQLVDLSQYRWNWRSEININPRLEWLLDTMLSPNVAERFKSAGEVIKILESISFNNSLPKLSTKVRSSPKQQFLSPVLKAQIKFVSLREFFPKEILLLSLLTIGLLITYIYPKQLAKLPGFSTKSPISENLSNSAVPKDLQGKFSVGEKILILQQSSIEKKTASQAFAQGDYARAASLFSAVLKSQSNDPEALIYFSNALISEKKSYTIAVPVPIGKNVNSAKEILRGVAQAQYQINQSGGINQIPLKIQIVDDNKSVDIAQRIAESLGENSEILGVIGHYTSDMTLATAKIYEKSNLVAISPISSSVKLSNYSPYIFRTVPSDYIAARALAQYMKYKRQKRRVAVFYNSQSDHSESLKLEFRSAVSLVGGQVVAVFDLSDPNFDATTSFEQALHNGAEAIMLSTNPNKLDKAIQVIQVNNQRLELLAGDDVYTAKTLQIAMKSAKSLVLAVPWHIKSNPESDFVQMAQKLWGGDISWRTAMAYDATKAWISAIESNRHPTRLKLQQTLANPDFSPFGVDREIKFSLSGDRLGDIQLVEIKQAKNDFGYEFTPLSTSSPISIKAP